MKNLCQIEYFKRLSGHCLKYFVFICIVTTIDLQTLNGQNFCNTTGGANSPGVLPQGSGLQPGPFTLKVYMHIIRRSDGSGGITLGQLEESKAYLDEAFAPHAIFFAYACDVIYIDNDTYYANPAIHLCGLISQSSHTDGLDVYIGGDDSGVGGSAGSVLTYAFAIGGTNYSRVYSRSHVISHEMGHCLGLWHTHHGTYNEAGEDCNGNPVIDPDACAECVDDGIHTNGDICGDYVMDTPADNNIGWRVDQNSCQFLGNDLDPCTQLNYNPSASNIMSYTLPGCMDKFTSQQGERMRALIVLDPGLSSRLLPLGSNTITHIYSNTTIDISQSMLGDIMVHAGAQLTILDCTIKMPWKSKIVVERGAVLFASNAVMTKACGAPDWQGIHVEGNANIEQPEVYDFPTTDQAGIVIIANNSTVEWARTAISTSRPDGYYGDYFGGLIYATNSQFLYNRRVAEFMKYDKVNKSIFDNCVLDGKNRFNTVGVTIWDCDNILFTFNDIQNMKIGGIYTIDGSAVVRNANNFSNCGDGIYTMATYPASGSLVVEGLGTNKNIFSNNKIHIRANNTGPYNDLFIRNNEFNTAPSRAIEIVGPSFYDIRDNIFINHSIGVYVADGGSFNTFNFNFIRDNNFTNSLYGINAKSENREMQFLCNDFACRYDFYNIGGVFPAAVKAEQGSSFSPANNCFSSIGTNLFDILSRGTALHFNYFTFTQSCKVPETGGNYSLEFTDPIECQVNNPFDGPINLIIINETKSLIAQIGEPQSAEMIDSLNRLKVKANHLRNYLIKQIQNNGNYNLLDSILVGEPILTTTLIKFSYHLANNNFSGAQDYLTQLPDSFPYTEFKEIQTINLLRLQNQDNQTLSSADSTNLSDIAYSDSPNRAFARSLLYVFRGIDILEPEVEEPQEYDSGDLTARNIEASKISIYPNPANSSLTISVYPVSDISRNFSIFDMQGIFHLGGRINTASENILDISKLDRGIYFLKIYSASNDQIFVKRFIVN